MGVIKGNLEKKTKTIIIYWGKIRIMDKKMDTTIYGWCFWGVEGLGV